MVYDRKKRGTLIMMIGLLPAILSVALLGLLSAQNGSTLVNYLTLQLNNQRTGWNDQETILRPDNIKNGGLRVKWSRNDIDGQVYAAPLFYNNDGVNMLIVATETNWLYIIDTDHPNDDFLFKGRLERSLTQGEFDKGGGCGDISPNHGITGTPVIDPENKVLYLVNLTIEGGEQVYKLHAIDLTPDPNRLGHEITDPPGFPITIRGSYEVEGFEEGFQAYIHTQRGALSLQDGIVYIPFSSRCDAQAWRGWVFGYNVSDPSETPLAFCTLPSNPDLPPGPGGAGIWGQGGVSIAMEPDGIRGYVVTGNANPDTFTPEPGQGHAFPQSVLRLNLDRASKRRPFSENLRDYFTIPDYIYTTVVDTDLGGSSALLIPNQAGTSTPRLLLTAGKDGRVYLINRDNLGGKGGELDSLSIWRGMRNASAYFESAPEPIGTGEHLAYVSVTGSDGVGTNFMDWQNDGFRLRPDGEERVALSSGPALAEFAGKLFVAWVNYDPGNPEDRSVRIKASSDGSNWPADATVVAGAQAALRTSPSLAAFGGKLYLSWVDDATKRIMVNSSTDGLSWSAENAQMLDPVASGNGIDNIYNTWTSLAVYNGRLYLAYFSNAAPFNILLKSTTNGSDWSADTVIRNYETEPIPTRTKAVGAPFLIEFNGKLYAFWLRDRDDRTIEYKSSTNPGSPWPAPSTSFNESAYQNSGLGGVVMNTILPPGNPPRLYILFLSNDNGRAVLARSLGTGPDNPDASGNQNTQARVNVLGPQQGANGGQTGAALFRGKAYYGWGTRLTNRELRVKSGTPIFRNAVGLLALRLKGDMTSGSRFEIAWTSSGPNYNYLPGSPFITSDNGNFGIAWVTEGWRGENNPAILHAYNAVTGEELFPIQPMDLPIGGRKFQNTVVVNGRVYLASNGVICYGLPDK